MDTLAILDRLDHVRPNAKGGSAHCPAHEDRENSLNVSTGDDGRVLLKCFAGCTTADVVKALGLELADLFADNGRGPILRVGPAVRTKYEIRDVTGELVAIHTRVQHGTTKSFLWALADGTSGLNGTPSAALPLYGSELLATWPPESSVVLTEGEKAADSLRARGVQALATLGADVTPSPSVLAHLAGRHVVLWPDNDAVGRGHMARISTLLDGVAASVRVVDWPDAPPKGDGADFGGDPWDLIDAAPPSVAQREMPLGNGQAGSLFRTGREIATAVPPEYEYVVRPWLAVGTITELDGKPKSAGKTTFTLCMIRAVLDGLPFLGEPTMQTTVVFLSEQSRYSIGPSLRAFGLDRDDVSVLSWPDVIGMSWAELVEAAGAECRRTEARMLVVDTVGQFVGVRGDEENNSGSALAAMAPLQALAAAGLAVWINRHDRKAGGEVGESGRGSNAWTGTVDCVMALRRPLNPARATIREIEAISRRGDTPAEPLMIEWLMPQYVVLGSEQAVAFSEARAAILGLLADREWHTVKEMIATLPDGSRQTVALALDALVTEAVVGKGDRSRVTEPYPYRLLPSGASSVTQPITLGNGRNTPPLKLLVDWPTESLT